MPDDAPVTSAVLSEVSVMRWIIRLSWCVLLAQFRLARSARENRAMEPLLSSVARSRNCVSARSLVSGQRPPADGARRRAAERGSSRMQDVIEPVPVEPVLLRAPRRVVAGLWLP